MSFEQIVTTNINLETINELPYPPSGSGNAAGPLNTIQLSLGDGNFKASNLLCSDLNNISTLSDISLESISGGSLVTLSDQLTLISQDRVDLLANGGIGIGGTAGYNFVIQPNLPTQIGQSLQVLSLSPNEVGFGELTSSFATLQTANIQLNGSINTSTQPYIMCQEARNGALQPNNPYLIPSCYLGGVSSTQYRLKIVVTGNPSPLISGQYTVAMAPYTVSAGTGTGVNTTLTYTLSSLPASQIVITAAQIIAINVPKVFYSSTFTLPAAGPEGVHLFYADALNAVWNADKMMNISAMIQQVV